VPNRGIGYGLLRFLRGAELRAGAQVSFNYLGQFDQLLGEDGLFEAAAESAGVARSERGRRAQLLDVNALVAGGRLRLDWAYSETALERGTVEALARAFEESLLALVKHCRSGAWGVTPADFPLARLDQATLDRVVGGRQEVEDIYPLAPMQEGMLLHTLMSAGSELYCEQGTYELEGWLDALALRRAWQQVMDRHAILRTRFCWEALDRPLQVVEKKLALPWEEEDWSEKPREDHGPRLEELLKADRKRGLELRRAPLMRMRLVRLGEESHRLLWSFHHALLDGWSVPLLWKEALSLYRAYTRGVDAELPVVRPYRDYIAWLAGGRRRGGAVLAGGSPGLHDPDLPGHRPGRPGAGIARRAADVRAERSGDGGPEASGTAARTDPQHPGSGRLGRAPRPLQRGA
jgi:non-ribosomal peptide synthase protein (TIGR01720 family)